MPTRSTPHRCRRRRAAWRHRLPLKGGVIGTRHSKRHTSFPPLHYHSRSPPPVIPASPPTVIPASFQRESSIFFPSATRSKQNHSPLEGESARQGRSPPGSRWGGPPRRRPRPHAKGRLSPTGAAGIPTTSRTKQESLNAVPMPTRSTPHRCRRRRAAWRHRLPLKGGVIGTRHSKRHTSFPPLHYHSRSSSPCHSRTHPLSFPQAF